MSFDLTFVDDLRKLEIEAVEGGRAQNAFSTAPVAPANIDDESVFDTPVDDVMETSERIEAIASGLGYMQRAYEDRGLVYPFTAGPTPDHLVIQNKTLAVEAAKLSRLIGVGGKDAKEFERLGLSALHQFTGGWGIGCGAPRDSGKGPKASITEFRKLLTESEGTHVLPDLPPNGDCGADGFLILGRGWFGPLVYYQAKNSGFNLRGHPEEYSRLPEVVMTWFGVGLAESRTIIPVLGLNAVLTSEMKHRIGIARGPAKVHILDAVDILCAKHVQATHRMRSSELIFL